MQSVLEQTGRCACGAVTFRVMAPKTYGACHCRMCRRWVRGVWMGVVCASEPDISGPVKVWKSSRIAERGFCSTCGSSIWHRPNFARTPTLGQGLFDDQTHWTRVREIFADDQPDHYAFGPKAKAFTGWGTLWAVLTGRLPK